MAFLPTAWRFGKASRIRLAIAGADADHYGQVPHGRPPAFTINRGKSFLDFALPTHRHDAFGDYIPPSTSVVMERCFGGGSTISTSLIAVVPEAGYEINKIYPPGVASSPTSGLVPAVICNEFVFVAGQMAHNPGTGLDPRVVVPAGARELLCLRAQGDRSERFAAARAARLHAAHVA